MADGTYNRGLKELSDQSWQSADIRVMLLTQDAGLTFDPDHAFVGDVLGAAGNSDSGAPRTVVPSRTATQDDANDRLVLGHGDVDFTALDVGAVGAAVYYRHVSSDANSPVWFYKDSGFPLTTNGSDVTIRTGAGGLATIADA
jgi:hypothetical protein